MAELFRSQVRFYGKHARYIEALTPGTENAKDETLPDIQRYKYLFKRVIDVYMIAPMVGYLYNRQAPQDGNDQATSKSVFEGAFSNEHDRMLFTYQLITVLDKKSLPDINDRLRRAFSDKDEENAAGLAVFDSYARGGIEVLYENLVDGASTPEDLANKLADFVMDFDEKFHAQLAPGIGTMILEYSSK